MMNTTVTTGVRHLTLKWHTGADEWATTAERFGQRGLI